MPNVVETRLRGPEMQTRHFDESMELSLLPHPGQDAEANAHAEAEADAMRQETLGPTMGTMETNSMGWCCGSSNHAGAISQS